MTAINTIVRRSAIGLSGLDADAIPLCERIAKEISLRLTKARTVYSADLVLTPVEFELRMSRATVFFILEGSINGQKFETSWSHRDRDDDFDAYGFVTQPVGSFLIVLSGYIVNGWSRSRQVRRMQRTIAENASADICHRINRFTGAADSKIVEQVNGLRKRLWIPFTLGFGTLSSIMALIEFGNPVSPFARHPGNGQWLVTCLLIIVPGVYGGMLVTIAWFAVAIACLNSEEVAAHPIGAELKSMVGVSTPRQLRMAGLTIGLFFGAGFLVSLYFICGRMWRLPF